MRKLVAKVEVRQIGAIGVFDWKNVVFDCEHTGTGRYWCLFEALRAKGLEPRNVAWISVHHPDVGEDGAQSMDSMQGPLK